MAQQKRSTYRKQKSDFPIFDYIDMLMPHNLIARFKEMPRHVRWTIVSGIASLVILWVCLHVVVGSLNYWIDNRGVFLKDAFYLPYELTARPLPTRPEVERAEGQFLVLPHVIANQYVLQIPLTEEELQATRTADLETFLALSVPVENVLNDLRESLGVQLAETPAVDETEAAPSAEAVTEAVPTAESEIVAEPAAESEIVVEPAAESEIVVEATVMPTVMPTVNPVQIQVTALDNILASLSTLNVALAEAESIDPVYGYVSGLQNQLIALEASGITMPVEVGPFQLRLDQLSAVRPPIYYSNTECLMAALADQTSSEPPCPITQRAWFVEQGDYVGPDGTTYNVAIAEFPRSVDAAWAIKQLFYRARHIGFSSKFALDDIIEYNYFFGQIYGVYTLTWSHENWVYSVSGPTVDSIDNLIQVFPY